MSSKKETKAKILVHKRWSLGTCALAWLESRPHHHMNGGDPPLYGLAGPSGRTRASRKEWIGSIQTNGSNKTEGHRNLSRTPDTSAVSLRLTVTSAPPKCSERPRWRSKTSPRTPKPPPRPPKCPSSSVHRSPTTAIRYVHGYDVATGTTRCIFWNFRGSNWKCFCSFWYCRCRGNCFCNFWFCG